MSPVKILSDMRTMAHDPRIPFRLTYREAEVMKLLSAGLLNKEIASSLNISLQSTKNKLNNIFNKMNVSNRVEAINKYYNIPSTQFNDVA